MKEALKLAAVKSWQTTLCGVLIFLQVLVTEAIPFFDGVPITKPDVGAVGLAFIAMLAFVFSRDHRVSSEKAGVKKQPAKPVVPEVTE